MAWRPSRDWVGRAWGYRGQSFVVEWFCLRIGVQPDADAEWIIAEEKDSPGWAIVGAEPAVVRVRVPNVNCGQLAGSVCLKLEDAYGNPAPTRARSRSCSMTARV